MYVCIVYIYSLIRRKTVNFEEGFLKYKIYVYIYMYIYVYIYIYIYM